MRPACAMRMKTKLDRHSLWSSSKAIPRCSKYRSENAKIDPLNQKPGRKENVKSTLLVDSKKTALVCKLQVKKKYRIDLSCDWPGFGSRDLRLQTHERVNVAPRESSRTSSRPYRGIVKHFYDSLHAALVCSPPSLCRATARHAALWRNHFEERSTARATSMRTGTSTVVSPESTQQAPLFY